MAMICPKCGMEMHANARFCWNCGQTIDMGVASKAVELQKPHGPLEQVAHRRTPIDGQTGEFVSRWFGGIGWLLVSFGTFLVALGWLGVFDSYSLYYDDPIDSLRLIGYGIVVLATSAIAFSVREFVRPIR